MRKIPRSEECPIDNYFIDVATAVAPIFHSTGHTPNLITLYSAVAKAFSVHALWNHDLKGFVGTWVAQYWLDCLDGYMARKYNQVTLVGDRLDHLFDTTAWIAVIIVLLLRYNIPTSYILIIVGAVVLGWMHLGSQQTSMRDRNRHTSGHDESQSQKSSEDEKEKLYTPLKGSQLESLDYLSPLCPYPEFIHVTKYFGLGTMNAILVASILMNWDTYK